MWRVPMIRNDRTISADSLAYHNSLCIYKQSQWIRTNQYHINNGSSRSNSGKNTNNNNNKRWTIRLSFCTFSLLHLISLPRLGPIEFNVEHNIHRPSSLCSNAAARNSNRHEWTAVRCVAYGEVSLSPLPVGRNAYATGTHTKQCQANACKSGDLRFRNSPSFDSVHNYRQRLILHGALSPRSSHIRFCYSRKPHGRSPYTQHTAPHTNPIRLGSLPHMRRGILENVSAWTLPCTHSAGAPLKQSILKQFAFRRCSNRMCRTHRHQAL